MEIQFPALWLPTNAVVIVLVSLTCVVTSYILAGRELWKAAIVPIAVAALLIRGYASADRVLHPWDERYHALVAKNLVQEPLVPRLHHSPMLPYDYRNWTNNYIWLHKPPLALWGQAASMRILGVSEFSMRLPSLLFSTASVAVTFWIGARLFNSAVGLLAAIFQTFNGFLVDLASGRRAGDHVDTLLIFVFELSILCALTVRPRGEGWAGGILGLGAGLAYLTKLFAGFLVLPVWAAMRSQLGSRSLTRELVLAGIVALLVAAPWAIYTAVAFPLEAAHERTYAFAT